MRGVEYDLFKFCEFLYFLKFGHFENSVIRKGVKMNRLNSGK